MKKSKSYISYKRYRQACIELYLYANLPIPDEKDIINMYIGEVEVHTQ
jgi:hypothetical protein